MGVNRVEGVPFAQIANAALRDKRLSFRARGILAMVLSHSGEWQANREWIARQSDHEGRQAIQTALNELTELGYRRVHKEQAPDGTWVTVTSWFHHPQVELAQESTETVGELVQKPDRRLTRPSVDPTVGEPDRHTEDNRQKTITEDHGELVPMAADATIDDRPDITEVISCFSQSLTNLGVKHTPTKDWHTTIRLMIDRDGITPDQILGAIRWAHSDDFWRGNIHSPRSLRKHFDRMRIQAQRPRNQHQTPVNQALQLAAQYAQMGI